MIERVVLIRTDSRTYGRLRSFMEASLSPNHPWARPRRGEDGCLVLGWGKPWRLIVCRDGSRALRAEGIELRIDGKTLKGVVGKAEIQCDLARGRCWVEEGEAGAEEALEGVLIAGVGFAQTPIRLSAVVGRVLGVNPEALEWGVA